MKKPWNSVVAGLFCLVIGGCYQKVTEDGNQVYSMQWWVPFLVAVGGIAAVPIGILLFRGKGKQRVWGVLLTLGGPVASVALAPTLYLDRVVVKQDGFTSRHGFWWQPITHQVEYENLSQVRLIVEEKQGRRGKTYSYFFDCTFKTGKTERIPLGDLMRQALPEIAGGFREHNIPVDLPPNLP